MNILVIGQCSLHMGRMEFGNIGNYYIIEPFFRELKRSFPAANICTTLQMSRSFCEREGVTVLPVDLYYAWRDNELELARHELHLSAKRFDLDRGRSTPYLEAVLWADLVIDFSGDIWGDNANFLGRDRFEVGLIKALVAQNLGKRTAMLAGSPGPFASTRTLNLARKVYSQFDLVTNREPLSTALLEKSGFDTRNTVDLACPAFLFEPMDPLTLEHVPELDRLVRKDRQKPIVGFILCGWNFQNGPFDRWPRQDTEYLTFVEAIEFISAELDADVCLMSHSNGFDVPPTDFRLKHGRDYPIVKQLQAILAHRDLPTEVLCLDGVYDAWQTKAIIRTFDMLVSGRVHAAVAALSQSVPTVIVDYGHEPKAHKLRGFATVAGVSEFVAEPDNSGELKSKIEKCWRRRTETRKFLDLRIPEVKTLARENFQRLKAII